MISLKYLKMIRVRDFMSTKEEVRAARKELEERAEKTLRAQLHQALDEIDE